MTEPTDMGQDEQPSEEEMRQALEQLRGADVVGLVAEAFNLLASAANVKAGRPDARVAIDAAAGLTESLAGHLAPDMVGQMRSSIAQLQQRQVAAENEQAGATGGAQAAGGEAAGGGDAGGQPAGPGGQEPAAGRSQPDPGQQPQGQRAADRLWIPGRGGGAGGA